MSNLTLATRDGVPVLDSGRPDIVYCLAMGKARFAQTTIDPRVDPSRAMSNLEAMSKDELAALYDHVVALRPAIGENSDDEANARKWLETNRPEFFLPATPEDRP